MGKHIDKIKKIDEAIGKFRDGLKILLEVLKEQTERERDKTVIAFTALYAYFNYQFSMYLIKIFPNVIKSDKIDKEFNNIMKNFDKRKKGKKR